MKKNQLLLNRICVLMTCFIVCISCSRSTDEYNAPIFKETIEVALEVLNDDISFTYGTIDCVDTLLIISNKTTLNKNTFHIFSANSGKYIKSFGSVGRGPGETLFTAPNFSTDYNNSRMYVYDTPLHKLIEYDISKVLNGDVHYASDIKMEEDNGHILTSRFYSLDDRLFLWVDQRFVIGSTSNIISCYGSYPRLDEPEEYKKLERSYFDRLSYTRVSPNKSKFAHATYSGCILETFSCINNTITPIAINRLYRPIYENKYKNENYPHVFQSNKAICGIKNLACTDEYIYATYSDIPKECSYKSIAVFDWNCQPVKLLSFEDKIQYMYVLSGDKAGFALAEREDGIVYLARFEL